MNVRNNGGDSKQLTDGTWVMFCEPHGRWEWDCYCGWGGNTSRDLVCTDCGRSRTQKEEAK